jgi:hypothetical protein
MRLIQISMIMFLFTKINFITHTHPLSIMPSNSFSVGADLADDEFKHDFWVEECLNVGRRLFRLEKRPVVRILVQDEMYPFISK